MGNARRTNRRAAAEAEKVANAAALAAARERARIICGESLDCLRSALEERDVTPCYGPDAREADARVTMLGKEFHEAAQALARAREAAEVNPHDR